MKGRLQGYTLAGFSPRMWGFIVDGFLVNVAASTAQVGILFVLHAAHLSSLSNAEPWLRGALLLLVSAYYIWGFSNGQTIGCRVAGLRIVDSRTGGRPGYLQGAARFLGIFIPPFLAAPHVRALLGSMVHARDPLASAASLIALFLLCDYLVMLADPERQTWHDKLAKTYVISSV